MERLIGKTVVKIELTEDNVGIVFTCTDGVLSYEAYADCCSESWFSSINGLQNLIGYKIVDVDEKPEQDNLPGTRQDVDILYGYTIQTEKGHCDIEFRNSSNGYYGGSCDLRDVQGPLKEVKQDF